MAIISKNLKPLKHTGNETKEELFVRLDKWSVWFENTMDKAKKEYEAELAGYKHREEMRQAEVTQERKARLNDGFRCECHSWVDTIGKLHDELVEQDTWVRRVQCVVNDWDDD